MIDTVLFDLDGTLLPMDQDVFVKDYFGRLVKKLAPYGYEPQVLVKAVWQGVAAMTANTGEKTNETVFWDVFADVFGQEALADKPVIMDFYANEFNEARVVCGFAPEAKQILTWLKQKGCRLILATNPLFPRVATENRIRWAGLDQNEFELITTYEDIHYCKPNPDYYREIVARQGLDPASCLMIGNSVSEDMAARQLDMQVFLLTDCLVNEKGEDISPYPHGGFAELAQYLGQVV